MTGSVTCRAPGRPGASRLICGLAAYGPLSLFPAVPRPPLSFPGPSSEQEPQA